MSQIALIALSVAAFSLAFAVWNLMRICQSHSARIKALEHFIYPEWEEERGFSYTVRHLGVKRS